MNGEVGSWWGPGDRYQATSGNLARRNRGGLGLEERGVVVEEVSGSAADFIRNAFVAMSVGCPHRRVFSKCQHWDQGGVRRTCAIQNCPLVIDQGVSKVGTVEVVRE